MAERLKSIPGGVGFSGDGWSGAVRLHLVVDADHYWFPANAEDLGHMSAFMKGNPGIELTLITRESVWETCLNLTRLPWVLPRHLIAERGEEILHLTDGGEWSPDNEFGDWKRLLGNPQDYQESRCLSPQAVALEYLECNCDSPRPLLICLGSHELKALVGLADYACLPASWAHMGALPADTTFLTKPSLKGILRFLEHSNHLVLRPARADRPILNY